MDDELQSISLRTKNPGKFLSPKNTIFSNYAKNMRNKKQDKKENQKKLFKYRLYCVSRTASCALGEIISKMKREENPLQKSEATSTPPEIDLMQQNPGDKLVLCILS